MTVEESQLRIRLEELRIERKRLELEIERERNRTGANLQAKLLADLACIAARPVLPVETKPAKPISPMTVNTDAHEPRKRSSVDWIKEIDRILEVVPPERVDRELFDDGPMSVPDVAKYLGKSEPNIRKLIKARQIFQLPNSSPVKICPRSVVLHLVGIPDPRLGVE